MDLLTNPAGRRAQLARQVLQQAESLNLPVIDIRDALRQHAVASLFYYPDSHYNETGARLVADSVLASLDRRPFPAGDLHSAAAGVPCPAGNPASHPCSPEISH